MQDIKDEILLFVKICQPVRMPILFHELSGCTCPDCPKTAMFEKDEVKLCLLEMLSDRVLMLNGKCELEIHDGRG